MTTQGRPSSYTVEKGDEICRRMASGQSLREVCRADDMPSLPTVLRWAESFPSFREQYVRAREALLEHWAEEIVEISDDGSNDWQTRQDAEGNETKVLDHEHIQRSRLRVDTRKWLLSKLAPRKYGEKLSAELTGPDGKPLAAVTPVINVTIARSGG
jgi:hypothetical protein